MTGRANNRTSPSDHAYYSAGAENAMMDRVLIEERVASAVAGSDATNECLQRNIDQIRLVTSRQ